MYTDSHAHLYDLFRQSGVVPELQSDLYVCASAHDRTEFLWQEVFAAAHPGRVHLSFGIHPQKPEIDQFSFLEELARSRRIQAIGECGFDLFTEAFRHSEGEQMGVWDIQIDLALRYSLPLVIHARKSLHHVFADTKRLKKLPAVVFHSWSGSAIEAESFLKRGINAWFSSGKALLRGDRSLRETVRSLPVERLLSETDAPYMQDRTEPFSVLGDIRTVVAEIAHIRNMDEGELIKAIFRSFMTVYGENHELSKVP